MRHQGNQITQHKSLQNKKYFKFVTIVSLFLSEVCDDGQFSRLA